MLSKSFCLKHPPKLGLVIFRFCSVKIKSSFIGVYRWGGERSFFKKNLFPYCLQVSQWNHSEFPRSSLRNKNHSNHLNWKLKFKFKTKMARISIFLAILFICIWNSGNNIIFGKKNFHLNKYFLGWEFLVFFYSKIKRIWIKMPGFKGNCEIKVWIQYKMLREVAWPPTRVHLIAHWTATVPRFLCNWFYYIGKHKQPSAYPLHLMNIHTHPDTQKLLVLSKTSFKVSQSTVWIRSPTKNHRECIKKCRALHKWTLIHTTSKEAAILYELRLLYPCLA